MPEFSLQEFLGQARRDVVSKYFGPDFLMKQTYLQVTNVFTDTYGRKVWDALNNQTVFWNAIPKVPWGPTTGWRVRSDRGVTATTTRSRPIGEASALPGIDVSAYQNVSSQPRIVGTVFGVSLQAQIVGFYEGGIGNTFDVEMKASERDHLKEINEELLAGTGYLISAGAAQTFTVPATVAHHFKIGDVVYQYDLGTTTHFATSLTVSGVNTTTGVVTYTGTVDSTPADGDCFYIHSRLGYTSLDDVVAEDGMLVGGAAARSDVYNLTTRTAGAYAAGAYVGYNSGVGRDLTLDMINTCIQNVRTNGGNPKLIICGDDQYFKLESLLQAQQRFMGVENYVVGVGDSKTFPGTQTGLELATYMGIPILRDADTPHSVSSADVVLGSNLYVLDTDYLEIAIAQPTQYVENRDFFTANALVIRGLLYTMGEFRCHRFDVQAKLADLNS